MFALLSQHCVPLHSFPRRYAALFLPSSSPSPSEGARCRTRNYIEVLTGERQMSSRYMTRGEDAMLPEVPYERFHIKSRFFMLAQC